MKNKNKLLQSLEQISSNTEKLQGCYYEQVGTAILKWFSLQRSQNIPIDGTMIKEKALFLLQEIIFQTSKLLMAVWISKVYSYCKKKFIFLI